MSAEEVRRLLPGALLRPPARRLDLYRDRALGASTFVLIDGVFFQQLAVAPREVLDLLADGARVIGASSMGALRAAECWPSGMVGRGVIYRLFKRGVLDSDDEVAVSFQADRPERGSVALVNVRYAARRAVRSGRLSVSQGDALVSAAQALFFSERHWPRILGDAGIAADSDLRATLVASDLKRADAMRCLRYVAQLESLPSARRVLVPRDLTRERGVDAQQHAPVPIQAELVDWLVLSGRYRRWLAPSTTQRDEVVHTPPSARVTRALWQAIEQTGQLDAELFRFLAFREGVRRSLRQPVPHDDILATRARLAREHGAADWSTLLQRFEPQARRRLFTFARRLAAARSVATAP